MPHSDVVGWWSTPASSPLRTRGLEDGRVESPPLARLDPDATYCQGRPSARQSLSPRTTPRPGVLLPASLRPPRPEPRCPLATRARASNKGAGGHRRPASHVPSRDGLRRPPHAEARGSRATLPPPPPPHAPFPTAASSPVDAPPSRRQYSVLIMGLDNAGKTTFLGACLPLGPLCPRSTC